MKRKRGLKRTVILLCCALLLSVFFSACGTQNDASPQSNTAESAATQPAANAAQENDLSSKKIVIVQDVAGVPLDEATAAMMDYYASNGCKKENITVFNKEEDLKDPSALVGKVMAIKPDIINVIPGMPGEIRGALSSLGIPVVVSDTAEIDCDESGTPKASVTGLRSMPLDLPTRLYKMLDTVAPINGKKAAFISFAAAPMYPQEMIKGTLAPLNIELKEYAAVKNSDEAIAAAEKFGKDDEIGWVLIGMIPNIDSKGQSVDQVGIVNKIVTVSNKPLEHHFMKCL